MCKKWFISRYQNETGENYEIRLCQGVLTNPAEG